MSSGGSPNGAVRRKRTAAPPPSGGRKFRSMAEIMREAKRVADVTGRYYADVRCEECRSGERDKELLLCDRCDKGYHIYCLRPVVVKVPKGAWFCPLCADAENKTKEKTLKSFPVVQTKIMDFFKIQRAEDDKCGTQLSSTSTLQQASKKRKRRSVALVLKRRRRRILPYVPSADENRRIEQMGSLASALVTMKMVFCNDLTYMPGMASRYANQADLEKGGMQVLAKEDKETLEYCRAMYKRGECPPLIVVFDPREGFTVQADAPIKDMTFITEYTGDVDYLRNREHDKGDSIMTLLLAENTSKSLVICPDKRGNIGRFINGINNHTPDGRKKLNVKCVRFSVDGKCRVLLVACRDIAQGERLYYDYNGYEKLYPTAHFV